jgi:hypothetical protein
MDKKFVQVLCDVHCDWEGLPPSYRLYVNDELFTERTWTWTDEYLEELLQIEAEPGEYKIRYELVPPYLAKLHVKNMRIELGEATVADNILKVQ